MIVRGIDQNTVLKILDNHDVIGTWKGPDSIRLIRKFSNWKVTPSNGNFQPVSDTFKFISPQVVMVMWTDGKSSMKRLYRKSVFLGQSDWYDVVRDFLRNGAMVKTLGKSFTNVKDYEDFCLMNNLLNGVELERAIRHEGGDDHE
jgi:hypothetical protein